MSDASKAAWVVVLVVLWLTPDRQIRDEMKNIQAFLDIISLICLWHFVRDLWRENRIWISTIDR